MASVTIRSPPPQSQCTTSDQPPPPLATAARHRRHGRFSHVLFSGDFNETPTAARGLHIQMPAACAALARKKKKNNPKNLIWNKQSCGTELGLFDYKRLIRRYYSKAR